MTIERPGQPKRFRHAVRRTMRLELIEEPQAFLGEREREVSLARDGSQRRRWQRCGRLLSPQMIENLPLALRQHLAVVLRQNSPGCVTTQSIALELQFHALTLQTADQ